MPIKLSRVAPLLIALVLATGCCSADSHLAEVAKMTVLIHRTSQLVYRESNRWPRDESELAQAAAKLGLEFRPAAYHMEFQPQPGGDTVVRWLRLDGSCRVGGTVRLSPNEPSSTQPNSDAFLRHLAGP